MMSKTASILASAPDSTEAEVNWLRLMENWPLKDQSLEEVVHRLPMGVEAFARLLSWSTVNVE